MMRRYIVERSTGQCCFVSKTSMLRTFVTGYRGGDARLMTTVERRRRSNQWTGLVLGWTGLGWIESEWSNQVAARFQAGLLVSLSPFCYILCVCWLIGMLSVYSRPGQVIVVCSKDALVCSRVQC